VVSVLLKKAVEWEVIDRMPCTVKLLRVEKGTAAFHDFDKYERLVEVARSIDPRTLLLQTFGFLGLENGFAGAATNIICSFGGPQTLTCRSGLVVVSSRSRERNRSKSRR
jgi:hypothetical protein